MTVEVGEVRRESRALVSGELFGRHGGDCTASGDPPRLIELSQEVLDA